MLRRLLLVALLGACSSKPSGPSVQVAAASDLSRAFGEIFKAFTAKTGIHVIPNFGSSGQLAKQIAQAAPYSLFAAANRGFVDQVIAAKKCDPATARLYGRGRIVVWTASEQVGKLEDLAQPRFKRIAIANPDHAPYGLAAKQALEKAGLWETVKPKLVLGENIQATMRYAREREVEAAIVALSLAVVADGGRTLPIDQALHDPLDQSMIVCGTGPEADRARQLADFVVSSEGREIMNRYGFVVPEH